MIGTPIIAFNIFCSKSDQIKTTNSVYVYCFNVDIIEASHQNAMVIFALRAAAPQFSIGLNR